MTSAAMIRRTVPAVALLLGATLAGCAGDPMTPADGGTTTPPDDGGGSAGGEAPDGGGSAGSDDTDGGGTGNDGGTVGGGDADGGGADGGTSAHDIPTTDDVLDLPAEIISDFDRDMADIVTSVDEGLSLADIGTLESTLRSVAGDVVFLGAEHETWLDGGNGGWALWAMAGDTMHTAEVATDLTTILDHESMVLDPEMEHDEGSMDMLTTWELQFPDAAEVALAAFPGEVLAAIPPNVPAHVLFVVVREEDGGVVRVAFDSLTGEPINAVRPDLTQQWEDEETTPAPAG